MMGGFDPSPRASKRRRITVQEDSTLSPEASNATMPLSKKSNRSSNTREAAVSKVIRNVQDEEQTIEVDSPEHSQSTEHAMDDEHDAGLPRSSGRERKRPRRFSLSSEPTKTKPKTVSTKPAKQIENVRPVTKAKPVQPKGILTPSRKEKIGVRKSVAFDSSDKDVEAQLGFKDIDTSKKKPQIPKGQPNETPTKNGGRPPKPAVVVVPQEAVSHADESEVQQLGEDDLGFDQLLEVQQWNAESPPTPAADFTTVSLEEDPAMLGIKCEVLSRLLSSSSTANASVPAHLQTQYQTIHNLLTATISTGESNSLLLLGSRGSGKTHLLKIALDDMLVKHTHDFHTVRLNGFFQTDDKLALREIWRQLGREMNVDEDDTEGAGSYADTMASLLSLLSHPDEFLDDSESIYTVRPATMSKSIVFILDEFDLLTTHPRQTLLYNLFDIAQSRKAPIAVIGCSTRMDVVECLEKRVKSRFSHRWVHLPGVKSADGLATVLETALLVDEQFDSHGKRSTKKEVEARKRWNHFVKTNFLLSTLVQDLLKRVYYTTKSIPELFTALYLPIATLRIPLEGETEKVTQQGIFTTSTPQLIDILYALPTLHLSLLTAACRLDAIHNMGSFNFNLVYNHYTELIARAKLQQTASGAVAVGAGLRQWSRDVAQEAWEDLGEWSMIVPMSGNSGQSTKDMAANNAGGGGEGAGVRMWRVDISLDDLVWALKQKSERGGAAVGALDVLNRWCREI